MILPGLFALHAVGSAGEKHERRARGHDLAARLDPLRVLDLRLLGEVDLLAGDLLAQDGAVDHRHDTPAELAHEPEARAVGVGARPPPAPPCRRGWRTSSRRGLSGSANCTNRLTVSSAASASRTASSAE